MDKSDVCLVTGGMGFMGHHLVKELADRYFGQVVVLDAFTYAARPNVKFPDNVIVEKCDIRDHWALSEVFKKYPASYCFHLAAESHVCRSIEGPRDFVHTNIIGTFHVAQECWKNKLRLVHISTDEVFGEIKKGRFKEHSRYEPRSPYAASKAGADHIVRCYGETFQSDFIIIHPSNNFGPNQHEEKLIPRTALKIFQGEPVIVHGKGDHLREWLFVEDFVQGVIQLGLRKGNSGESYCLGGEFECTNLEMIHLVHNEIVDLWPGRFPLGLRHTDDRPTDDFRYAMSSEKAKKHGFKPQPKKIKDRLRQTVLWYFEAAREPRIGGQG